MRSRSFIASNDTYPLAMLARSLVATVGRTSIIRFWIVVQSEYAFGRRITRFIGCKSVVVNGLEWERFTVCIMVLTLV